MLRVKMTRQFILFTLFAVATILFVNPIFAQEAEFADTYWSIPMVTQEGDDIKVEWDAKSGANLYHVFYWNDGMQDWGWAGGTESTELVIKSNSDRVPLEDFTTYYFHVRAYSGEGENLTRLDSTWYSNILYVAQYRWLQMSTGVLDSDAWTKYRSLYPNRSSAPHIVSVDYNNKSGNIRITFLFPGDHTKDGKTGKVYANQIYRRGVLLGVAVILIPNDGSTIQIQAYEGNVNE